MANREAAEMGFRLSTQMRCAPCFTPRLPNPMPRRLSHPRPLPPGSCFTPPQSTTPPSYPSLYHHCLAAPAALTGFLTRLVNDFLRPATSSAASLNSPASLVVYS